MQDLLVEVMAKSLKVLHFDGFSWVDTLKFSFRSMFLVNIHTLNNGNLGFHVTEAQVLNAHPERSVGFCTLVVRN